MDEVGRGTTMRDGVAIAFGTILHLYFRNHCRSLFATHFHEVADMLGVNDQGTKSDLFPEIRFFCTDVDETEVGAIALSGTFVN